jgi:hypothetical protein
MLRCTECKREAIEYTRYMDWLKLMHFIEFLYNEEDITKTTRDSMQDALMTFGGFAKEQARFWEAFVKNFVSVDKDGNTYMTAEDYKKFYDALYARFGYEEIGNNLE